MGGGLPRGGCGLATPVPPGLGSRILRGARCTAPRPAGASWGPRAPNGGLWRLGWARIPHRPPRPSQLPIVASSIVTLYFLELTDLFKPAKVGFQCYDRALSMPYVETNEELIPLLMLLSLAFAAPAASVRPGHIPLPGGGLGGGWILPGPHFGAPLSCWFPPRSWLGRASCTACSPG